MKETQQVLGAKPLVPPEVQQVQEVAALLEVIGVEEMQPVTEVEVRLRVPTVGALLVVPLEVLEVEVP